MCVRAWRLHLESGGADKAYSMQVEHLGLFKVSYGVSHGV